MESITPYSFPPRSKRVWVPDPLLSETCCHAAGLELELALCLLLDRPAPAGLHILDLNDFTLDAL